jgi:hypothetical protein
VIIFYSHAASEIRRPDIDFDDALDAPSLSLDVYYYISTKNSNNQRASIIQIT